MAPPYSCVVCVGVGVGVGGDVGQWMVWDRREKGEKRTYLIEKVVREGTQEEHEADGLDEDRGGDSVGRVPVLGGLKKESA
jgi:hypothetical protein